MLESTKVNCLYIHVGWLYKMQLLTDHRMSQSESSVNERKILSAQTMRKLDMYEHIAVATAILVNCNILNVLGADKIIKTASVIKRQNSKASDVLNGIHVRFSLYEVFNTRSYI